MNIETLLKEKLQAEYVEVVDESHLHAGHGNFKEGQVGTHYRVLVISALFEKKPLIERHRLVNEAIFDQFQCKIHALAIKALTPEEHRRG